MKPTIHSFACMGTRCTIVIPGEQNDESDHVIFHIQKECERVEQLLSWFSPKSELYRLNRNAHLDFFPVSKELFTFIKKAKEYHIQTDGYFDPTMRSLMKQPSPSTRIERHALLGFKKVQLNEENHSVYFENNQIDLDFGALGKGYALDQAKKILDTFHIPNALISFGNSSILALGNHPAGEGWPIGMQEDPTYPRLELPNQFVLHNESLSISESYRRNKNTGISLHEHIQNPLTGQPIPYALTTVVQSDSALEAEAWSTALLCMPKNKQMMMISTMTASKAWISSPKEMINS